MTIITRSGLWSHLCQMIVSGPSITWLVTWHFTIRQWHRCWVVAVPFLPPGTHINHMAFFKCWFANSKIWLVDYWVFVVEVFTYMETLNCLVGILGYDKLCAACWHLPWKPSEACSECVLCCNIQVLIHDICDVRSVHTFPSHSSHLCPARIHTRPTRVVLNPAWLNHFHVCFDRLIPRFPLQNNKGGL